MSENPFDTASIMSSSASILTTDSDATAAPLMSGNPVDTASLLSTESYATTAPLISQPTFTPTMRLQIQAQGFGYLSMAQSTSDLQIVVFGLSSAPPYKCERPGYISSRPSRASGNCTLVSATDSSQTPTPLSSTTYSRIPGNNLSIATTLSVPPTFPSNDNAHVEVKVELKSHRISRATTFTYANTKYQWRYAEKKERAAVAKELGEDVHTLLLLEEVVRDHKGKRKEREGRTVARFIRGEESRTPGTKRSHSGNGGRLEVCLSEAGVEDGGTGMVEVLVLSTCLVMMKKEVDEHGQHRI